MSIRATCGVRDHATLLAQALEQQGYPVAMHWLSRDPLSLAPARGQVRGWRVQLAAELREQRPEVVLLHYSPFSYAYRGIPIFVPGVLAAITAARGPIVCMAHELVYPWGRAGLRGRAWAITQRVAMLELMRASAGVLVTADFQRRWLASRRWLPARPTLMAPVFSNLPAPASPRRGTHEGERVGLFGYAYQGSEMEVVLDALALLHAGGRNPTLALLGAPGRGSDAANRWLAAARARGVGQLLQVDGPLPAQQLSDELAACDVLVSCARLGPSSRKGTLAGSLASGAPVVALDGPLRWQELIEARALQVVAPTAKALADGLAALLDDRSRREQLGARGRAFAESRMGLARTRDAALALFDELAGAPAKGP